MKSHNNKLIFFIVLAVFFILISNNEFTTDFTSNENESTISTSGSWTLSRVIIDDTDPDLSWSKISSENPWCYGSGTLADPYIVENITINYQYVYRGGLLEVRNSRVYFIIRHCSLYRTRDSYGSGIFLLNTTNGHVTENYCSNANGNGIGLDQSDYNLISTNNIIDCDGEGIELDESDHNIIFNNTVNNSESFSGILLHLSSYNEVLNNTLLNCNYGTWFWWSDYNTYTNNYLSGNGRGIWMDAIGNNVTSNDLIGNYGGIYSEGGIYNDYVDNVITGCRYRGFSLDDWTLDNNLYGNILYDNGDNAIDDGQGNLWNCSTYGNYWDDYAGRDANDDGIGDDPYIVPGAAYPTNGIDYLPFWDDEIEGPPYFAEIPDDFSMVQGDEEVSILWNATDLNKNFDSYWIVKDGSLVYTDTWDGSIIIYDSLYLLEPGVFNFTCFVNDTDNGIAGDTVFITVNPDIYSPLININDPIPFQLCGNNTIGFNLSIYEPNLNETWYSLNGGLKYTFPELSGFIEQNVWDIYGNGTVTITFYANDSYGNLGFEEIIVRKDTHFPILAIIKPEQFSFYAYDAPEFEISVVDSSLEVVWYNINGTSYNFEVENNTGIIEQATWNSFGNGSITLYFSARNTAGNTITEEILIYKDIIPPEVDINHPTDFSFYAGIPPSFNLTINERNLNKTWYILNSGSRYYFTGTLGIISQEAWDLCGNGTVLIGFYAEDLANQISYDELIIFKDIIAPIINISEPSPGEVIGLTSPIYNFSIQEGNLDSIWYRLDDGAFYFINDTFGQIDQTLWDSSGDGSITIRFYANDTLSNIGYAEIIVVKDSLLPEITIISPLPLQLCGLQAPNFNVSIYDVDLHNSWYTLNDGGFNLFIGTIGVIDQNTWSTCGNGTVKITFYANNSLGHLTFNEVVVRKETRVPGITIISPIPSDTFGSETFQYEITVDEPSLDTMWYSFNNGTIYLFTNFSGIINQFAWDSCSHGSNLLTFYANNSLGNLGHTTVLIYKDLEEPVIIVTEPYNMELFGNTSFGFDISINDPELNTTWYNLDGGFNYVFIGLTGTVDQSAWDECGNGTHTLTFYANDTFGNIGFALIIVQKDIFLPLLSIDLPNDNQWCGPLSASFRLTLIGNDIHTRWYTLNDLYMHEFAGTMGRIDQQSWDLFGEGTISIKFYANNSAGNYIMKEVLVNKRLDIVSKNAYAIVIGVSNYPGSSYDLNYCDDDADEIYNMLINDYNFLAENVILLKNSAATKSAIDNAFATINSMIDPDDIFYFYYSGHGGSELTTSSSSVIINSPHPYPTDYDRTWYISSTDAAYIRVRFSTIDIEYGYDYLYVGDATISEGYAYQALTGYGTNYWTDWIPVLNDNRIYLRLVSDWYHSGDYGFRVDQIEVMRYSNPHYLCPYDSIPSNPSNYYLDTLLDSKLDSLNCNNIYTIFDSCNSGGLISEVQDTGRFILTACKGGQTSYEDPDLQNGVFTYYLLNSLDSASDQNSDGVISLEECFSYVSSRTQSYSSTYGPGYRYHPQLSDGIAGQAVLYPAIGSVYTNAINNQLYYSFYLYGHGNLRTLNLTVCSISPTITFKTEEIKYQYTSPTGFGFYAGVIELEEGYIAGGIRLLAEVDGYGLVTIDLTYGDSDGDGLTDFFEIFEGNGLNPALNDTDGDGLLDGEELYTFNTDPLDPDSDSDGLLDGDEVNVYGSNPLLVDSDFDGISDYDEVITYGTFPMLTDSDADGLSDYDEIFVHFTDPINPDTDSDMVSDGNEINIYLTDPFNNDTDSDGLFDGEEIYVHFTSPLLEDTDLDGLNDYDEINVYSTDPLSDDTDSDTIPDGWEIFNLLNPLLNDSALDPDNDTLSNVLEYQYNTYPFNNDTDSDFLLDGHEVFLYGTNPSLYDTDSDGLSDYDEIMIYFTDPTQADSDSDGISDYDEIFTFGTDPSDEDTDSDTMPDGWEIDNLLDPFTNDTTLDPDNDFLINIEEFQHGTLPRNNDTDSDGLLDGEEVNTYSTNPTIADTDSDGLLDGEEVITYNTDPLDSDTDSDGLLDGEEVHIYNTDPLSGDTDSDTMPDQWEVDNALNPLVNDTMLDPDMDDLVNILEYEHGTDPQNPDTDYDGWTDGEEIEKGTDPLDPNDHPSPPSPPPPGIPGYHIIIFLSIAGLISLVLMKKKKFK